MSIPGLGRAAREYKEWLVARLQSGDNIEDLIKGTLLLIGLFYLVGGGDRAGWMELCGLTLDAAEAGRKDYETDLEQVN